MELKTRRTTQNPSSAGTRRRLLEAAGSVFAERGFRAATIREICGAADVNLAAVGYHFCDKEGLYLEVLRYAYQCALEQYPPLLGVVDEAPAEERLQAFVRSLLLRILGDGRPAWHGKLIAREMSEPTPALAVLIEEVFRPLVGVLESLVREILGAGADDALVRLATQSVLGQCLLYRQAAPVLSRVHPQIVYGAGGVEDLTRHVVRFSILALRGLRPKPSSAC